MGLSLGGFLCGLCSSCGSLFGGLCCGSSLGLSLLLGDSLGTLLVHLGLCLNRGLGLGGSFLGETLLLGSDLGIPLGLPVDVLLVSLLLGESTLGDTTGEVMTEEDAFVGEEVFGLYDPSCSMKRPSRGARESATTMWKNAKFFLPWRCKRILTAIVNLFCLKFVLKPFLPEESSCKVTVFFYICKHLSST